MITQSVDHGAEPVAIVLPLVEELRNCRTDAERAEWLLTVPHGVLQRDLDSIQVALREARFFLGIECLAIEFSALNAVRCPDGALPEVISRSVETARTFLRDVIEKGVTS